MEETGVLKRDMIKMWKKANYSEKEKPVLWFTRGHREGIDTE